MQRAARLCLRPRLRALIAAEQPAIEAAKRKGGIVDVHWLIHAWGNEYNAIEMITRSSWASVFQGVHHEDGIYFKVP